MFWKNNKASDSTLQLQVLEHSPDMNPVSTSAAAEAQYTQLQNIDHNDEPKEKVSNRKASTDPSITVQRQFFSSDNLYISRARTATFTGTRQRPNYRPLPDMAAHIPLSTSAFKLVATFDDLKSGHYSVRWRVKATKDFCIPNGLHFSINVSYDTEPDISGTLDIIMPPHRLNTLVKDRWYNLILEEKMVVRPHIGKSSVQLVLRNNENKDRVDFFGFVIEHVEIRPIAVQVVNQAGILNTIVPKASNPNFSLDIEKLRLNGKDSNIFSSTAPITRLASSEGSRFLVSLAQAKDTAYITVWDISVIKNPFNAYRNLTKVYKSCANAVIEHPGIGDLELGIAISSTGNQVAIFQEPKIGEWADGSTVVKASFPFRLFDNPLVPQPSFVLDMDASPSNNSDEKINSPPNSSSNDTDTPVEVLQLKEVESNHGLLRTFVGYGTFLPEMKKSDWEKNDVNVALNSTNEDGADDGNNTKESNSKRDAKANSMFVACNGLYIDVFEISWEKKWKRLHTITLSELLPTLSRRITCKMMMESVSSNTFMWLEDGGRSCTIWNLLTGSNITHISSIENASFKGPTFRGHSKMAISPHESIVALASVDGSLTTYFTNTGMAIDDRKFPGCKIEYLAFQGQDDQLFVMLRNSTTFELTAKILDTLQLKSELQANQVPIPTIGQTILTSFNIKGYWNRGIICEPDGNKINFYVSYQASSSKISKDSPTVIKAEPEDIVYESMFDDKIQYRLKTGIHRELLPEGDGVSYWVLRVEVVEENVVNKSQRVIFSFVPEPWMRITTNEVSHPENLQSAFFVPCGTRFAIVGVQTLQLWNLPTRENPKCSLQFIWSQPKYLESLEPNDPVFQSGRVRDHYMDLQSIDIYMDTTTSNTVAEIKMNNRFKGKKNMVSLPGIGTIGARFAIVYCFRSIHLLAAAFAHSQREISRAARNESQVTFTYEEHADAIVRFTREHINRMMSIGVYRPKKRRQSPTNANQQKPSKLKKDDEPADLEDDKAAEPETVSPTDLNTIDPTAPVSLSRKVTIVGEDITIHGNANKHDDDDHYQDDQIRAKPIEVKIHNKRDATPTTPTTKPRNSEVVTILSLLLDQKSLQRTNHIFVEGLLNTSNGDWIPRDNKSLNPIKRAIEARNGQLVEAFIEYCIKNAKKYHPSYLMPAVQCLNELSDRYPALLADMFRKASYVPAHNHAYVSSHAVIANRQYGGWILAKLKFWNIFSSKKWEKSNMVNDYERPVFSLRSQLPFRASSFMSTLSIETSARENRIERYPQKPDEAMEEKKEMQSEYSHKIYVAPFPKLSMYGPYRPWFQEFAKAKSAFVDIAGQDFFDSPAMIATLQFKWFVLTALFDKAQIRLQGDNGFIVPTGEEISKRYMDEWEPVFKATIGVGLVLFVYEILQFLDSPLSYIKSPYNYTDLAACVTPVIGCFIFLSEKPPTNGSPDNGPSQVWVMSFAILALYMNIAGQWDPLTGSFESQKDSTSFHIMMAIFFFATTILLLNILIALMNDAFNESKDQGQLAWLKQWSEVIAEVEIFLMTQGTRQNRNYFPDFIYYGASEQEAELYESKFYITNKSNLSTENRFLVETIAGEQTTSQSAQRAILRDVQALTKDLERMKQSQDGFNQNLTKITELMATFIAQTTEVTPLSPGTESLSQVSPVEIDPHTSRTSPTTPPSTAVGTPGGVAIPGGVYKFAAAAQRRAGSALKQPTIPTSVDKKVSASALETESPTTYSPTTRFNTPQNTIEVSTVSVDSSGPNELLVGEAAVRPALHLSSAPHRGSSAPEPIHKRQATLKRVQQKLAVIRTMDDVLKAHQSFEDNNASHPMYVTPPNPRSDEDEEEGEVVYDSNEVRVDTENKHIAPVHHQTYYSSSSMTYQHQEKLEYKSGEHIETHEHPRRVHSDIVIPTVPHESLPPNAHPLQNPSQDSKGKSLQ
ncbi:hypothetical protein BGZ49_007617 [Haplosporangium sp. Z 27]|nr:hypothetical protein BGZ49_007617 [Haplosporangium sp. Z 27]